MRVIAGKARRINLITAKGLDTRPTTDRIKETLFNMINPITIDAMFLDLYSGSGAIAIEALSRGAKHATLVENAIEAIKCIKSNLKATKLEDEAELVTKSLPHALDSLTACYDIVFMDPPYKLESENDILAKLKDNKLVNEESLIIIEADLNRDFEFVEKLGYQITKEKKYKTNKHVFLRLA
ncbi:MAG: 16S rRNA (guanine(966)-N(2))-methyltransferase RsmD [Parasporobacterium sp.]|nr:16S rRNA (guanine(966)-N(2))-methyltransferase RsmD [Parasporobacterium sp.]